MDIEINAKLILKLIDKHKNQVKRYERLQKYYEAKNDILDRVKEDNKPNNKLVSGYPSYISDLMQGMIVGKPITYTSSQKELIEDIQDIFNYNDEQDENSELAKKASVKGRAYEIVYTDEDAKLRFNVVDPEKIIMVHDDNINPEPLFAIRYYTNKDLLTDKETLYAEVYTKEKISYYDNSNGELTLLEEQEHYFEQVPIIEYLNNDEGLGDFERVLTLIDAYDKTQSDTANDFEEFTDAFLCLVNLNDTGEKEIDELKEDKVLLLDNEGDAKWLIKDINDKALENYKNRLNADIHKFAKTPDMSDEKFAGNISGESMKFKLMAMDQVISAKTRKFKRGLQKRLELITKFLETLSKSYDYRDIDIIFANNKPINEKEMVEMAIEMLGITSKSTALSKVPGVDDVELELEKIEKENSAYGDTDLDKVDVDETG